VSEVRLSGIRKAFGATEIISDLNLHIEDGEFVVLVGPSGCGKSTLLRMIAGLESIDQGEMVIAGNPVNDRSPRERNIAMVFQNYALYPHMNVRENMSFALKLAKADKKIIDDQVRKASSILGLDPLLDRLPRQLSGGQRQRVAMGRAIVRDPAVFLFDEPLSNLDAKLRVQMRAEIRSLHDRLSATTIYVTHDQVEAMTMADKIVVMRAGRVEQVGTPMDLYARPANIFVATFLGSPEMNLLDATEDGTGYDLGVDGKVVATTGASRASPVTLGVRPHDISILPGGDHALIATVSRVELTGPETILACKLASGQEIVVIAHGAAPVKTGDRIGLALRADVLHRFDATTGQSLAA
jgi:multiple sugar transport system ATP-binding protein